ncbi:MAG: YfhO family protein [Ruminococcus sp.]|nr:YfhO family protein [Ruminococcus sp.]
MDTQNSTAEKINKPKGKTLRKSRIYEIFIGKGVLCFLISFLIPAVIMTLAFRSEEIHPFGDNQMLVVDLWHQYYPFFRVVREKLLTGGSFLYSWQNGMGTNFLSLISYYAASPLNWLSVFFSEEHVRDALTFILIAKIGFSGAFFSCFLRYTFRRKDFSICIFSTMFALCSYMLGYYWNVMWFDTIALFPLVMMGVVAIAREKKWMTFTFSLALSLIANYYIGYFTCIFTIFMFAAAVLLCTKGVKDFFHKLWIMIRSSVLGIALDGFILLPAYYGLQLTHSANNVFPSEMSLYESWIDIFSNMLSYSEPATKEGLPNFACGMLAIVLFGVFLFSSGIKIREKISALVMLAVITVSCNINILNYIWHGFHFTNMIPYRFAFIFSFVLVAAAFRAYDVILTNGLKIYQIILMLAFPWVVFYLKYMSVSANEEATFSLSDETIKNSLIISAVFIFIFLAIKIFPFNDVKKRNSVMSVCIGAAVVCECYSNALIGVQTVGHSSYSSYPTKYEDVSNMLALAEANEESVFYRTEMMKTWTLNDSALYGYYGISQFSSAANESVTRFLKKLGLYASEAGNRYYYRLSTPIVNSMLGLKYLISREGEYNGEEMALSYVGNSDQVYLYENNYPLSLGYMVDSKVLELENKGYLNPFEFQNELVEYCTGIEEPCFTAQPVALASTNNGVTITKNSYGSYSFTKNEDSTSGCTATYTYDGIDGYYLYGYLTNGGLNTASVKSMNRTVDSSVDVSDYPIVFPMGNAQSDSTSEVELKFSNDSQTGSFKLMVYALSQSVFEQVYEELADEQLNITKFSDTEIEGTITAEKDGVMLLSIPYEEGWSVYVDGEEVDTVEIMFAMLGANVSAGTHSIRIVYVPEGFTEGTAATAAAAVICVVIIVFDCKRRKKEKAQLPEGTDDTDDSEQTDDENTAEEPAEVSIEDEQTPQEELKLPPPEPESSEDENEES